MATKLKFIHTADIHLGSILHLSSSSDGNLLDIVNNGTYYAFQYICSFAIDKQVDFIIISGDLYDKEARSVRANSFFIEQCQRLKENNIKVYLIFGNHDPLTNRVELFDIPENIFIFNSENASCLDYYNREGELTARIVGQSYRGTAESRKMHNLYTVPDNSTFNIALLHTQLNSNNKNYVPSTTLELKENKNINYWALGHIHKYNVINKSNPTIVYPGIPQGRDIGEEGIGGALLVEVEDLSIINMEFIVTALAAWKKVEVKIDEDIENIPENLSDLEELMLKKAEDIVDNFYDELEEKGIEENCIDQEPLKGFIIRWAISGKGRIHEIVEQSRQEIEEVLIKSLNDKLSCNSPFIWSDSVEFRTSVLNENIDKLIEENHTFREVEEVAELCISDERMKMNLLKIIGDVFEYSEDHENFNEQKLQIDDNYIAELILKAKQLAFEKLLERGDIE